MVKCFSWVNYWGGVLIHSPIKEMAYFRTKSPDQTVSGFCAKVWPCPTLIAAEKTCQFIEIQGLKPPSYCTVQPPSTAIACPVINDAPSEHRKTTVSAISSGCPILPIGLPALSCSIAA